MQAQEIEMLKVQGVSKLYERAERQVRALSDVSFSVSAGEVVAVLGPSGAGKTTLLFAAGGLLAPDEGRVEIDGVVLYSLSPDRRARFRAGVVGFVFQEFHLIPYLSVLENVLASSLSVPDPDAGERAERLVAQFGMANRTEHLSGELSTGEKQRTALARALLCGPKLLLADEPTGNLDQENSEVILNCVKEFAGNGGAVIVATHDIRAAESAHRVLTLSNGRIVE